MNYKNLGLYLRNYKSMEQKELKKIIHKSTNRKFLEEKEFILTFQSVNEEYNLRGFFNLNKFLEEQLSGWTFDSSENHPEVFKESHKFFYNAIDQLNSFLRNYVEVGQYSDENISYHFSNTYANSFIPNKQVLTYFNPTVDFIKAIYKFDKILVSPVFTYITGGYLNTNDPKNLEGYLLAFDFQHKENSFLFKKRESEKKSFSSLRAELINFADDYRNEVIEYQLRVKEEYKILEQKQSYYNKRGRTMLLEWILNNRKSYIEFQDKAREDFSNLFDETDNEIKNLHNQYSQLLKLQEPVKYWGDKAKELKKSANIMLGIIGLVALVFAILVYSLLWYTPEGLLESLFKGDSTKALRWSLVFIIFVSIFFVFIRALLKMTFSNFHLARDAEEREKLTYLYISLLSKNDVSEEEKKIVFQALFSRSDTGLLKEDSSPTMPGVSTILQNVK